MSYVSWPSDLPVPNREGYQEGDIDTTVSDPNDIGVQRKRPMTTKIIRNWSFTIRCTYAQRNEILTSYKTTLGQTDFFYWTEPLSDEVVLVQIQGRPVPTSLAPDVWDMAISLQEV